MRERKIAALTLSAVCTLAAVSPLTVLADESDDDKLEELMDSEFKDTMESDYLTMHFTLKDPDALDIEKPDPVFGDTDFEGAAEEAVSDAESVLEQLDEIDYDSLSEEHQYDYEVMYDSYTYQKNWSDTKWDWMFTADNNLISAISTNMTEFVFYTKEDFDDYISVLDSVDEYIDAALELTKEQADSGYFMNESSLDESLTEISDFMNKTDDNPLIVDFNDDAEATDLLTDEEKAADEEQVKNIVINDILPACQTAYDTLDGLRDKCVDDYSDMEDGLAYYTAAEQQNAGTQKSLQDQFDELDAFIQDKVAAYYELYQRNQDAGSGEVSMSDPDEILNYLSTNLEDNGYPACPDVNYTASYLDPSVVSGNVMAYYMESPVDDYQDNVIKINADMISDNTEFYNTLAHEGYPGHLYQHVYYLATEPNYFRTLCGYLGYQEGWAEYVSNDALTWGVLSDDDAAAVQYNNDISYGMIAMADIAVHGLGWTESDLADYLNQVGLQSSAASSLYDTVMTYPISYEAYGYGLCRFTVMRENAEEELGSDFDEVAFHEVLLAHGDRLLDTVEEDVNAWVEEKGGTAATDNSVGQSSSSSTSSSTGSRTAAIVVSIAAAAIIVIAVVIHHNNRKKSVL
jgi:uncharacterized protein (DUF885 family)